MTAQVAKGPAPAIFRQLVGREPQASFTDVAMLRKLHRAFAAVDDLALERLANLPAFRNHSAGVSGAAGGAGGVPHLPAYNRASSNDPAGIQPSR